MGGVIHYVDELLESEKKFLLFAHHTVSDFLSPKD